MISYQLSIAQVYCLSINLKVSYTHTVQGFLWSGSLVFCLVFFFYIVCFYHPNRIEDTESTTADGILHCIRSLLISKGIPNWTDHLVGFGADGASVNFGCRQGIYTKLKNDMPWLMGIHCLAHRLELACKNAFQGTYFNQEVCVIF